MILPLLEQLLHVEVVTTKLNYGLNPVHFPAPVPVEAKIRLAARLAEVTGIAGEYSSWLPPRSSCRTIASQRASRSWCAFMADIVRGHHISASIYPSINRFKERC
jgi:hypothetical protein